MLRTLSAAVALLLTSSPIVGAAQAGNTEPGLIFGVEVGLAGSRYGSSSGITTPIGARVARFSTEHRWEFHMRGEYQEDEFSGASPLLRLGLGVSVARRLTDPAGQLATSYVFGGPVISTVGPDFDAPMTRIFGVAAGVGRRTTLGGIFSLLSEAAVAHDFGQHDKELYYPAGTRLAVRFALMMID